jgi:hypothetical protein
VELLDAEVDDNLGRWKIDLEGRIQLRAPEIDLSA